MLSYLGVWSLGLFSPTFFSTSSKKNGYLPDREASLIKKEDLQPVCAGGGFLCFLASLVGPRGQRVSDSADRLNKFKQFF